MRDRLMALPAFVLFLIIGIFWFVLLFVVNLLSGDRLLAALEVAAIGGGVLGLPITIALKHGWRVEQRALGGIPKTERSAAVRAARTGPVPADPEVRAAALRLAQTGLERLSRWRRLMAVVAVIYVATQIVGAIVAPSFWSLLSLLLVAPSFLFTLYLYPKSLRARIAALSDPQEPVLRTQ